MELACTVMLASDPSGRGLFLFRSRHYAAVVATEVSPLVLVGIAKLPEGLLTQILVPLRDFILL